MTKIKYSGICRVCAGIFKEMFIAEAAVNIEVIIKYTLKLLRLNFLINGMYANMAPAIVANINSRLIATNPICSDNNSKMPGVKGRNKYISNNHRPAVIDLK